MSIATIAATSAAATAAAAYLDAKFHIRKDLTTLSSLRAATKRYTAAVNANKQSLWYPFEEQVARFPANAQAIWSREGCYTWRQTHAAASRYGRFLLEQGVQPGELVALTCQNSAEFLLAWFGMWAIGCAPAMINYNLEGEGLMHCLRVSGAKVVLVDEDEKVRSKTEALRERIETELGTKIVILDKETREAIDRLSGERIPDEKRDGVKGTDPALLVYTSGTTGFPKAVSFNVSRGWAGIGPRVANLGINVGPGPDTGRWYDPMPMYHGTGANCAYVSLTSGITICVGRKFSVTNFWDEIRAADATAFVYVGEVARYLLAQPESPRDKDHRVRMMFGNGLRPDVWVKFRERFGVETVAEFFNSSEGVFGLLNVCHGDYLATAVGHHGLIMRTLLNNTYIPVAIDHETNDIARDVPSSRTSFLHKLIPTSLLVSPRSPGGPPSTANPAPLPTLPSLSTLPTSLTNASSSPSQPPPPPPTGYATRLPYTTGGEILVRVPSAALSGFPGYHRNPSASAKKFAHSVFAPGDLFYRSGDALRRDDDGRWFFLDRLGDTFRWKSENVSTAEVAHAVGLFPRVTEANVYGVLVPGHDGRAGCAAISISGTENAAFDFRALHAYLRKQLPKYAVPVFLRVREGVAGDAAMHNQKQNKVPLREEGVDLEKIRGEKGVGPRDRILWAVPGREAEGYVEFGTREWESLQGGKARL